MGRQVDFMSQTDFKLFYANQFAVFEPADPAAPPKKKPIAELWLRSPGRRTFSGITFAPNGSATSNYFNLWTGWGVKPLSGSVAHNGLRCRRFLHHLKYNVCRGNKQHFRYLLTWAADMFQRPLAKPGVALVMRGMKGTGKSKVADVLRELVGVHAVKISNAKHLIGNFNKHLADKLLIVAEESFWAGRRSDEGPLKDLITAPSMLMEAKGVDAVEVPSLCRIIMVTNDEWAVPASSDERRYFVVDVSDARRKDTAYFGAIDHQLGADGKRGYRALLGLLMSLDLAAVNLRAVPETAALRAQRALSMSVEEEYIQDLIASRVIGDQRWDGPLNVEKAKLHKHYLEYGRARGELRLVAEAQFAKVVVRTLKIKSMRPRAGDGRRTCVWPLPTPEVAQSVFARQMRIDIAEN